MTKEELKKEAEEYALNQWEGNLPWSVIQKAYYDGALPREKRIAELEEISTRLESYYQNQKVQIAELEAQVKKMRNCGNCKHFYTVEQGCSLGSKNYFCMLDKWELAE